MKVEDKIKNTECKHPYAQGCRLNFLKGLKVDELLCELLATIHRDGGHHTDSVGLYKSVYDAENKIAKIYAEPKLQALKGEVDYKYNKSVEEAENLSNEDPILFSKGKRNAFKEVLNLITNLEDI